MPKTDGLWFCKEREKYPSLSDIPVVVLSADNQILAKTLGLPVSGVLTKPVKIGDLYEVLHRHIH